VWVLCPPEFVASVAHHAVLPASHRSLRYFSIPGYRQRPVERFDAKTRSPVDTTKKQTTMITISITP
jgi:hypothetical protein